MIYALRDRLAGTGYGYCAFRRIRQHLGSDLDGSTGDLPNLLDLRTTLADQRTALRSGNDQSERDWWPRHTAATTGTATLHVVELGTPFLKLLAYQRECLEDRVRRSGDGHYSLRAGTVGDVDFRARLRIKKRILSIIYIQ